MANAQKYHRCTIQLRYIFVSEAANAFADPRLRNGCDFIHHEPAKSSQPIAFARFNHEPKKRSIGRVSGECADGDRIRHVETVVLQYDYWTGLSGIVLTASNCPNFAPLHTLTQSETSSMKFWSTLA